MTPTSLVLLSAAGALLVIAGCASDDSPAGPANGSSTGGSGAGAGATGGGATGGAGAGSTSTGNGGASGGAGGTGGAPTGCAPGATGPTLTAFTDAPPFEAESGATYSGLRVSNPNGPCITVTAKSVVVITDSDIGPCGGEAAIVVDGGSDVTIERNLIHHSPRGVLGQATTGLVTRKNDVSDIDGQAPQGTAIEYDYIDGGGVIDGNCVRGSFGSDAVSGFESSNLQIVHNAIQANMTEPSAAGFTIGDSVAGQPGHDNYVAYNVVVQTGGVPPGVFGSSGNTVLEYNCLAPGVQAYPYNGPFVGVTVQYNVIGPGWFVPDTSLVAGWDTNTFSADGSECVIE